MSLEIKLSVPMQRSRNVRVKLKINIMDPGRVDSSCSGHDLVGAHELAHFSNVEGDQSIWIPRLLTANFGSTITCLPTDPYPS
jgi:hypothetical protein